MSLQQYPVYKDSSVEWLQQVPQSWRIVPLRYLCTRISTGPFGTALGSGDYVSDGIPVINPSHILDGRCVPDVDTTVAPETAERLSAWRVAPGDLVVARRGDLGRSAIVLSSQAGWICGTGSLRLSPDLARSSAEYLHAVLQSSYAKEWLKLASVGSTMPNISETIVGALPVAIPPTPKGQISISAFVGRETAKIDELVAEQRRLIDLLKEKRQAVISHTVTQGLNLNAPMKLSGVEWLGEIPAHWKLNKIKHLARSIEQGWSPQCEGYPAETEGEWGVLKVGCVNGGTFNPSENKVLPSELEPVPALAISRDDLLISRANTRELVGGAAVAKQDYPSLMLCDKLYRIRFSPGLCCPQFVSHYLGSTAVRGQIELEASGASSSMLNIGQSAIMELSIPTPEIEEQRAIVAFLDQNTTKLDTLISEAQRAIDLLQERRTALISAAVTGQIDVRGLVEAEAA